MGPTASLKVLLVEDNPGDVRLIRELLAEERGAFELESADRLSKGLDRLAASEVKVVLLDLGLPDSQGLETFLELHRRAPDAPTIVLTGLDDQDLALSAVREGAQDYLVKGQVDGAILARAIRYAVERKRAKEALEKQNRVLESILHSVSDGIVVIDNAGRPIFNPAAESIFGYGPANAAPAEWSEVYGFYLPDQATPCPPDQLPLVRALGGEDVNDAELFLRNPCQRAGRFLNVSARPLKHPSGLIGGAVAVFRDVTDRRRAEAENRRLAAAVEQAADAIFVTKPDGTIQYVNPAFERITGYARHEAIGQTPRILKSGRHGPELYEQLWAALLEGNVWTGRFTNRRKDGGSYHADVTISPVRDARGELTGFVCTQRDVSAQLELEEQLRRTQKMEAVSQLASGLAHDYNNLMTAIKGFSELALMTIGQGDPLRSDLEIILGAAESATTLTRRLLAFARQQILEPETLDLNPLIDNLAPMLRRMAGEDIEFELLLTPDLPPVRVDPGQIEQVLVNLVVNAVDAMPSGGKLLIKTEAVDLDDVYAEAHIGVAPGRYLLLSVSDTGLGMDAETQARIFEPFFTTKAPGKGTGLGLASVYGIVKQSNGHIWVYSEVGRGTTFRIYFPVAAEAPSPHGRRVVKTPKPEHRGLESVLVVEDNDMIRELIRRVLTSKGYTVVIAPGPHEALEMVAQGRAFDLVITDVIMPRMTGIELAERLRQKMPHLKIMFMSGHMDRAIVRGGAGAANTPLLQKPFTADGLLNKVREALAASP